MLDTLKTIKRKSVYEQVVESLKQYIVDNSLQPGDRLPTEAVIAERLGVSRLSVREAFKVMETLGVVQSRTSDGTRMRSPTVTPLSDHLGFLLDVQGITLKEIVIARQAVECSLMPLIVQNAQVADFQRIEASLARMHALADQGQLITEADLEFHEALLAAAHNQALQCFGRMLQEFFSRHPSEVHRNAEEKREAVQRSIQEHEAIYRALQAKDAETAQQVMKLHLTEFLACLVEDEAATGK